MKERLFKKPTKKQDKEKQYIDNIAHILHSEQSFDINHVSRHKKERIVKPDDLVMI